MSVTITETIHIRGYDFEVKSSGGLTEEQKGKIIDAFVPEIFNNKIIKALSKGHVGEPHLKFEIRSQRDQLLLPDFANGSYGTTSNTIFLPPTFATSTVQHELTHAVSDFASTRLHHDSGDTYESGFATDHLIKNPKSDENLQLAKKVFLFEGKYTLKQMLERSAKAAEGPYTAEKFLADEMFVSIVTSGLLERVMSSHRLELCPADSECYIVGDKDTDIILTPAEISFLLSLNTFLENYPVIQS